MSEQQAEGTDPVRRQAEALGRLSRIIAERNEAEATLEQEKNQRAEAAQRSFDKGTKANEARHQAERAALARRAKEEPEAALADYERKKAEADERLKAARAKAEQWVREKVEAIKKAQAEQRWEVGTICEAGLDDAKLSLDRAQTARRVGSGRSPIGRNRGRDPPGRAGTPLPRRPWRRSTRRKPGSTT
jgi:membrane protein involved in colicin uptake